MQRADKPVDGRDIGAPRCLGFRDKGRVERHAGREFRVRGDDIAPFINNQRGVMFLYQRVGDRPPTRIRIRRP